MRYVESLKFDGDVTAKRWSLSRDFPSSGSAVVYDTLLNKHQSLGSAYLARENSIVGVGRDDYAYVGVAVCHQPKTAMLHRFVESADYYRDVSKVNLDGVDSCIMFDNKLFAFHPYAPNCKSIMISTPEEGIQVMGYAGSVVMRMSGSKYSLCTLYDFLMTICRGCDLDLLRYKNITLFSESLKMTSIIHLSDSTDAERFFTKMRFDITRRM